MEGKFHSMSSFNKWLIIGYSKMLYSIDDQWNDTYVIPCTYKDSDALVNRWKNVLWYKAAGDRITRTLIESKEPMYGWHQIDKETCIFEMLCSAASIDEKYLPLDINKNALAQMTVYLGYITQPVPNLSKYNPSVEFFNRACREIINAWDAGTDNSVYYSPSIKDKFHAPFPQEKEHAYFLGYNNQLNQEDRGTEEATVPQLDSTSGDYWAPIAYSRTYSQDYRILAIPSDVESEEAWIKIHINASIRYPEQLRTSVRWCIFSKENLCVFGISCMADHIADHSVSDEVNRRIPIFLGYVSTDSNPKIPDRNIEDFRRLFSIIQDRWHNHTSFDRLNSTYEKTYFTSIQSDNTESNSDLNPSLLLNSYPNVVRVWKDSKPNQDLLWRLAVMSHEYASLCLGLFAEKDARMGPFTNVSLVNKTFDNIEDHYIENYNELRPHSLSEDKETALIKHEEPLNTQLYGLILQLWHNLIDSMKKDLLG